jgi:hypothetical protein
LPTAPTSAGYPRTPSFAPARSAIPSAPSSADPCAQE